MKKIILCMLPLIILLGSCSKKNTAAPDTQSVTINGTVYPIVTIGNQIWTAQNYSGPGGSEILTSTGDAMLNGNYYNTDNITLPAGWRIPTRGDYNALLYNYSSSVNTSGDVLTNPNSIVPLLSKDGWSGITGTNSSGFSAYAAGELYSIMGGPITPFGKTENALYLTSTVDPASSYTYVLEISNSANESNQSSYTTMQEIGTMGGSPDIEYVSLRFVKDK